MYKQHQCVPSRAANLPILAAASLALACLLCQAAALHADEAVPREPAPRWWKGNIHTHSLWSDGDDFPEMIAEWYRTHGYNFLALSDHNVLSEGQRWMKLADIVSRGGPTVLPKYQQRFGGGWVETRGTSESDDVEVRLKPLSEFRALVEERGRFILIRGEEISDQTQGVPVHMNATNIEDVIQPVGGATVREAIANNLRAVQEQARRKGREILVHLNHPNFGYAITAEDIAAVVPERFFEVYNGHPIVGHLGDANHPGVERLWDIANTIRVDQLNAPPLLGLATDDSHTYHGKPGSHVGRGWVMVRASYLTPEHLIRALRAGDFYASSGASLRDVRFDPARGEFSVTIAPDGDATYTTQFIGTRSGYDRATEPGDGNSPATKKYSAEVGEVFRVVDGLEPVYRLQGDELYVRAVITSSAAHADPSFPNQQQQAWTQPFTIPEP